MVNPLVGQKVYLDSCTLIYATETPHLFPNLRARLFEPVARGDIRIVTSWLTLAEVLVHPLRANDTLLEMSYRRFCTPSTMVSLVGVDAQIASRAASIRSLTGLSLPDAIHIATGIIENCAVFVTGDQDWTRAGVSVVDPVTI